MQDGNSNPVTFLVIGAGDRGFTYSRYSNTHPDEMKITGIAEPNEKRRTLFAKEFGIDKKYVFTDYKEAFLKKRFADAVIISTPDNLHYKPAVKAMKLGYNILLEKPIANTKKDCIALYEHQKKHKGIFAVCHVLRYDPFYQELKKLIDSGALGEVISIEHSEGVGWWHIAHSYVRGNWRNSEASSPMILAKSCHDMDILLWLIAKPCRKISSFGSLIHFRKKNVPEGSTPRCTDGCKVESECPYSALKLYLNMDMTGWPISTISDDLTYEGRMKAIKEGPYGRCVYRCDNNVVDHQVVSLEFKGGTTASFTMCGFTEPGRNIRIMGTMGEAEGNGKTIKYVNFRNGDIELIDTGKLTDKDLAGHEAGDEGLIVSFIKAVKHEDAGFLSSALDISLQSHLMAFAAEESRLKGKIIEI